MASQQLEITKLRLEIALTEYRALRDEVLQKFRHHLLIYSSVIAVVASVFGVSINTGKYDLLLITPIISIALTLRYIWEQHVIVTIGKYIMKMEEEIFPELVINAHLDEVQTKCCRWMNWDHYFKDNFPNIAWYKPAVVLILIVVPIILPATFSCIFLYCKYFECEFQVNSDLGTYIHITALLIYIPVSIFLTKKLWET